jgi:ribA/ribD-fused uncharacterized protein
MQMENYTLEALLELLDNGKTVKYLFFWGHTPTSKGQIDKSCLSQWWEASFEVSGEKYLTAEHWMMAEKARLFGAEGIRKQILASQHPKEAKKLGRQVPNFDGEIWEQHRFDIVVNGNLHKFRQNPALKTFLIGAANRVLVEASPVDAIWGIGMDQKNSKLYQPHQWKGLNLLGFALMKTRDLLKNEVV